MSENHRKSSYGHLPSFIMEDENLEDGAKILYARIDMYSQEGRCWASNEHLAEKQKVTVRCIQLWLKQLLDCEYIEIDIKRIPGKGNSRDIWIKTDFKKMFTKRTTVHPPLNHSSPRGEPQFTSYIEDKEQNTKNNNKEVVVSSILKDRDDLTEDDKISLSRHSEERLVLAIEFSKIHPPTKTLAQLIHWHCTQKKPPIPDANKAKTSPEANKELAKKYSCDYISNTHVIEILNTYVEFASKGPHAPICLDYSEIGFKEKLEHNLKKCGFIKKKV